MNPNLAIFLKGAFKFLMVAVLVVVTIYAINNYTAIDLEKIGAWLMYGFFGLVMAFMLVLITGVMFKSLWTSIMRRSDRIYLCCLDKSNEGFHIVGSHYFSGGDAGDGYDGYHHYYIRFSDGRIFLSKRIKDEKDFTKSLADLSVKTNRDLQPDRSRGVEVGPNTDSDDKSLTTVMRAPGGEITLQGFDHWVDSGFRVWYSANGKKMWRRIL